MIAAGRPAAGVRSSCARMFENRLFRLAGEPDQL
jgi:hypothetical protein